MATLADCSVREQRPEFVGRTIFRRRAARVTRGVLLLILVVLTCAVGQAMAQVKVNEIESNGGTPGDWVEIYNPGTSSVNISRFVVKDNDDSHAYIIPEGTSISAGGYYVVDVDQAHTDAQVPFGLGSADMARLFDTTGALVDSYTWTAHASTTYGRCPNGTGPFTTTVTSTKGAANDCGTPVINEIESNGGTPGDWVEIYNPGTGSVNISRFVVKDNDDSHAYVIPDGTSVSAGGYYVVDVDQAHTDAQVPFGLGSADMARLFDTTGALVDSYTWTAHASTTYGRCPNGTGVFTTTTSSTRGAANDCGVAAPASPVKINEVESSGGVPVDWIELYNPSASPANIGLFILKDNDNGHSFAIPSGTTLAAGEYKAFDVDVAGGFGLGDTDSARLFDTAGTLVDTYSWTSHADTTYGRCPNGTGDFAITVAPTKGAANACRVYTTWPGGADVQIADGLNVFGSNMSGLIYEGSVPGGPYLWAVRNGPSTLFRLVKIGGVWTPDPADGWGAGKTIVYPSGGGGPDSEGVTFAAGSSSGGMYVATERDNNNNSVSRNAILRFDPAASGTTLTATNDWNLTSDLPVTGANLGAEAVTWIPDSFLTASNFFDAAKGHIYDPSEYANHGTGLFFVGLEQNGNVYAYALDQTPGSGAFNRIASLSTGFPSVMELQFDSVLSDFWGICDDGYQGRSVVMRVDGTGKFVVAAAFERPAGMPNINNEGFAMAGAADCVDGLRPAFWSDDNNTDTHAIRTGTLSCSPVVSNFTDAIAPKAFPTASPSPNGEGWNIGDATVSWNWADNPGGSGIDNADCTTSTLSSGEGTLPLNANCKDLAGNSGSGSFTVKVDKTNPTISASATKADSTPYTFGDWSRQTVTVHYTCSDSVSGIASCASDAVFSADGDTSTSGGATDHAGRSGNSGSVSVKVDKTPPSIVFAGNAGSYTVDEIVAIACTASDALSGLASSTCPSAAGPAYAFLLGLNSLNASATDVAGNSSTASTSFTVSVTFDSLASLTEQFLTSQQAAATVQSGKGKAPSNGNANSLLAKLSAAASSAARGNSNAKAGQLGAFINELQAQSGKALTAQQAAILVQLASQL